MKNHIAFKFIAIVLCAASLLGAVGGAVGMFALTELGLYDRTVEEAYEETLRSYSEDLADQIAQRYASAELGGAGETLLNTYYGSNWYYDVLDPSRLGYVLQDAEGNVLQEQTLENGQAAYAFTFPVSGSYMKVLSETPEEEFRQASAPTLAEVTTIFDGETTVYNAIPKGGSVEVYWLDISYSDGNTEVIASSEEPLGNLVYELDGSIRFLSEDSYDSLGLSEGRFPTYICFRTIDEQLIYEASNPSGVLDGWGYDGSTTDMELRPMTASAEVYDAIPSEGCAVSMITYSYNGGSQSLAGAPYGYLSYDESGNVLFTSDYPGNVTYLGAPVTAISFYDENEELVYQASDPESVGYFNMENGSLIFRAAALPEADAAPEQEVYRFISDKVPMLPSDGAEVYRMEYWSDVNDSVMGVTGTRVPIGNVFLNENGDVIFRCDGLLGSVFETAYLCLTDADGMVLFESYSQDVEIGQGAPVGQFTCDDNGEMFFTTDLSYIGNLTFTLSPVVDEAPAVEEPAAPFMAEEPPVAESTSETMGAAEETVPQETMVTATVPEAAAVPEATAEPETVPDETAVVVAVSDETDVKTYGYHDYSTGEYMMVEYVYEPMPEYTVEVQLAEGACRYESEWVVVRLLYSCRDQLPYVLGICLLVFAIMAVYLCCAAGKKPGSTEIRAAGLNCIPLDLYLAAGIGGVALLGIAGVEGTEYLLRSDGNVALLFAALCAFAASLLIVGFCFACAAQFKTPGGYWWRNSLCGRCLRLAAVCWKWFKGFCARFTRKGAPIARNMGSGLWKVLAAVFLFGKQFCIAAFHAAKKLWLWLWAQVKKYGSLMGKALARFYSLLPLTWQWLMTGFILVFLLYVALRSYKVGWILMGFGLFFAVILYAASAFGILLENAKRMNKGDLDSKVEDKMLLGGFKDFAGELNGLADVAVVAAQKQLKSERMKTELITNVSHDIKTPLTSIINYVDLLQKPHTDAQQEQYLEVLDRQSQRLKKLIDDLMEMSKASTGNLAVDIGRVDAVEAVNQALGEFADKLDKAQLIAVFRQPEEPVEMMADGRLVWRVMSNLLSNAVKYALPGTRLYVDLQKVDSKVIISMKNISREELNVNADELMERFVRGDTSRNTEGSGLGLNIAQSLMELQKGQLQLLVDGDLFKVTLIFPGA